MRENTFGARIMTRAVQLLVVLGAAPQLMAQDAQTAYPAMAPIREYLMPDRDAEVALARSAAPESVSRNATILVLGPEGFETAVAGTNGFVCMVDRSFSGPFDWPEFWNPKVRAAVCLNPQAARSLLPITELRTSMVLAARSRAEIVSALAAAFEDSQLPALESGGMAYMMSPSAYLTDAGEHNAPHLMFYTLLEDGKDWGAGAADSPVMSSPYWFFSPRKDPAADGLPPVLVFLIGTATWSDGTPRAHP